MTIDNNDNHNLIGTINTNISLSDRIFFWKWISKIGKWLTEAGDAKVEIYEANGKVNGKPQERQDLEKS